MMNPFVSFFKIALTLVTLGMAVEVKSAASESFSPEESGVSSARVVSSYFATSQVSNPTGTGFSGFINKGKKRAQTEELEEDFETLPQKKAGPSNGKGAEKRKAPGESGADYQPVQKKGAHNTEASSGVHFLLSAQILEILEAHSYPDPEELTLKLIKRPEYLDEIALSVELSSSLKKVLSAEKEEDFYPSRGGESDESEEASYGTVSAEESSLSDFSTLTPASEKRTASQLRVEIRSVIEEKWEEGLSQLTMGEWIKRLKEKGLTEEESKDHNVQRSIRSFLTLRGVLAKEQSKERVIDKMVARIEQIRAELKQEGISQLSLEGWKKRLQDAGLEKEILEDRNCYQSLWHYLNRRNLVDRTEQQEGIITKEIQDKIEAIKSRLPADNPRLTIGEWKKRLQAVGVEEETLKDTKYCHSLWSFLYPRNLVARTEKQEGIITKEIKGKIEAIKSTLPADKPQLTIGEWKKSLKEADLEEEILEDKKYYKFLSNFLGRRNLVAPTEKQEGIITKEIKGKIEAIKSTLPADKPQLTLGEWKKSLKEAGVEEEILEDKKYYQFLLNFLYRTNLVARTQKRGIITKEIKNKIEQIGKLDDAFCQEIQEMAPAVYREYMCRPSFQMWLTYLKEENFITEKNTKSKKFKALLKEFLHKKEIVQPKLRPDLCQQIEKIKSDREKGEKAFSLTEWKDTLSTGGMLTDEEKADFEFEKNLQEFLEYLEDKDYLANIRAQAEGPAS